MIVTPVITLQEAKEGGGRRKGQGTGYLEVRVKVALFPGHFCKVLKNGLIQSVECILEITPQKQWHILCIAYWYPS